MEPILAAVTGEGLLKQLGLLLVVGICILIIWLMGKLIFPKLTASALVLQIWDGLFILVGGFFVINFLMTLVGHPLIPMF